MLEQSAEPFLALDRSGCRRLEVFRRAERAVALGLVRAFGVVIVDVAFDQVPHVTLAEDDEMVQAFVAEGLDPAFGERVAVRRVRRQLLGFDTVRFDDRVEGLELAVAVVNEILGLRFLLVEEDADIARLLRQPIAIRASGDASKVNPARFEMDEEENDAVGDAELG